MQRRRSCWQPRDRALYGEGRGAWRLQGNCKFQIANFRFAKRTTSTRIIERMRHARNDTDACRPGCAAQGERSLPRGRQRGGSLLGREQIIELRLSITDDQQPPLNRAAGMLREKILTESFYLRRR